LSKYLNAINDINLLLSATSCPSFNSPSEFEGLLSEDIGKQVLEAKIKEIMPNHIPRDGKTCEKCQTMNRINAKFCDQCGNKFCPLKTISIIY